ncbi:MAG: deoxynucleoside kinase [Thermotogaceae bacterium]|nr:deoxynucleoside kinase [Thermotogaceae bacterium]
MISILSEELELTPYYELNDPVIEKMLPKFYHERKRWAFTLQMLFLTVRYEQIKDAFRKGSSILDRSIYGDIVFAQMLYKDGDMTEDEISVYKRLYQNLIKEVPKPDLMIYIRISTKLAVERIKERAREYEIRTEYEYWELLNFWYEKFIKNYDASPVLIINADRYDWVKSERDKRSIVKKIKESLKCLSQNNKEIEI